MSKDDHVGKIFVAEAFGMRRCMVCDQGFTREEASKHATVACHPRVVIRVKAAAAGQSQQ